MNSPAADHREFFISRAGKHPADKAMALEVARILEADGHTVWVQDFDFPNRQFMERMNTALETGARVICILTPEYEASDYCTLEWTYVQKLDPLNKTGRLIILRAADFRPRSLPQHDRVVEHRGDEETTRTSSPRRSALRSCRTPSAAASRRTTRCGVSRWHSSIPRRPRHREFHRAHAGALQDRHTALVGRHRGDCHSADPAGGVLRPRRHWQIHDCAGIRVADAARLRRHLVARCLRQRRRGIAMGQAGGRPCRPRRQIHAGADRTPTTAPRPRAIPSRTSPTAASTNHGFLSSTTSMTRPCWRTATGCRRPASIPWRPAASATGGRAWRKWRSYPGSRTKPAPISELKPAAPTSAMPNWTPLPTSLAFCRSRCHTRQRCCAAAPISAPNSTWPTSIPACATRRRA